MRRSIKNGKNGSSEATNTKTMRHMLQIFAQSTRDNAAMNTTNKAPWIDPITMTARGSCARYLSGIAMKSSSRYDTASASATIRKNGTGRNIYAADLA